MKADNDISLPQIETEKTCTVSLNMSFLFRKLEKRVPAPLNTDHFIPKLKLQPVQHGLNLPAFKNITNGTQIHNL